MTTTYDPKKELTEFKNICEGLLKAIDLDFSEADFELHHTGIAEKHAELYAHTFGKDSFFEKLLKHMGEITLNQWQDISTAPKDRAKVLLIYKNRLGNERIVIAAYHTKLPWHDDYWFQMDEPDSEYAPEGWYECSETHEYIHLVDGTPTYWMPLPAAPEN